MSKLPVEKITANVKNKLSKLLLVICRCKTCPLELSRFIPLSIIYSNSSQTVSRTRMQYTVDHQSSLLNSLRHLTLLTI